MSTASPASTRSPLRDWSFLLCCNFIWAGQFALVKLVEDEIGPLFTTAFPMLLATLLLVPIVVAERRKRPPEQRARLRREDVLGLLMIGLAGQVVAQLFATWGAQRSLASNASIISLSLPVATAFIAYLILRERMTALRWIGFALALAGVLVSSGQDLRQMDFSERSYLGGNLMVFLGVLGSAFYNVYSKKLLVRFTPLEVMLGSYIAACLFLVPVASIGEPEALANLGELSARSWTGLLLLAVLQYCVSMVIFLTVLARIDATQAAVSNYLIPVFGVLLAWLILGERLQLSTMLGGGLVLASTLIVTVWEERLRRPKAIVLS